MATTRGTCHTRGGAGRGGAACVTGEGDTRTAARARRCARWAACGSDPPRTYMTTSMTKAMGRTAAATSQWPVSSTSSRVRHGRRMHQPHAPDCSSQVSVWRWLISTVSSSENSPTAATSPPVPFARYVVNPARVWRARGHGSIDVSTKSATRAGVGRCCPGASAAQQLRRRTHSDEHVEAVVLRRVGVVGQHARQQQWQTVHHQVPQGDAAHGIQQLAPAPGDDDRVAVRGGGGDPGRTQRPRPSPRAAHRDVMGLPHSSTSSRHTAPANTPNTAWM